MSDKMPELKPCPFCGESAFLFWEYFGSEERDVGCKKCDIGWRCPSEESAVKSWNQRADLPKEVDLGAVTENVLSILFNRTGSNRHIFYAKSIINTVLDHLVSLGVIKDKGV